MSGESLVRALVSHPVMSVQAELDAVTRERDNLILERDRLEEEVTSGREALEEQNTKYRKVCVDLDIEKRKTTSYTPDTWQVVTRGLTDRADHILRSLREARQINHTVEYWESQRARVFAAMVEVLGEDLTVRWFERNEAR